MEQSYRRGARLKYGTVVTLTVSLGSPWYYMEDYVGARADAALEALSADGVENVSVEYIQSDSPAGTIVAIEPEAGVQSKDTPVRIVVSGQRIAMPSLTGLSLESAQALIEGEGLRVGTVSEGHAADAKAGTVIAQGIAVNTQVLAGSSVDLTVNQAATPMYYPNSKLSIVVPIRGCQVRIQIRLSSGDMQEVYQGVLSAGTYRIALSCAESGLHSVFITMDGVLMEEQIISFE